jgi:hypothetical protein
MFYRLFKNVSTVRKYRKSFVIMSVAFKIKLKYTYYNIFMPAEFKDINFLLIIYYDYFEFERIIA